MSAVARTLVLGGSGFVGRELTDRFGWPGTSSTPRDGFETVDATRLDSLQSVLGRERPEVVVNCVGLADVDRAEREPAFADSLNHLVVENIVRVQRSVPFRLVHISTDYVFDGAGGQYRESDPVHPINEYGRSKLAGERAALRSDSALVLRISSPFGKGFGARKPQFFRYVADTLGAGKAVKALTDQRVTATYLPDLARAIPTLLERDVRGVVHVGSEEPLTRFEFALRVARQVGADTKLVTPGLRAEMTQWVAPRPLDTTLDVELSRANGVRYTSVPDALREALAH